MRLGICSRSNDVIEPMVKPQWFVDCSGMAKEACEAVRDGRLEIMPKHSEADWFRFEILRMNLLKSEVMFIPNGT